MISNSQHRENLQILYQQQRYMKLLIKPGNELTQLTQARLPLGPCSL